MIAGARRTATPSDAGFRAGGALPKHRLAESEVPALIDGNNLLHAAREIDGRARELDREQLCAILAEWARRRRQAVTIVYDGAEPQGLLASQLLGTRRGLRVVFSGRGVSADDRIAELLAQDTATRSITVVSADREVRMSARRCGARSVRSDDFWLGLRADEARWQTARAAEPREKRGGLAGDALETWLKEFSIPSDASFSDAEFQRKLLEEEERAKANVAGRIDGPGSADDKFTAGDRGPFAAGGGASSAKRNTQGSGTPARTPSAPSDGTGRNPAPESRPPIVIDHTPHGRVDDFGPEGDALLAAAERMVTGSPDQWQIGTPEDALDAMRSATPGVTPLDGDAKEKRRGLKRTDSQQTWDDAPNSGRDARPASGAALSPATPSTTPTKDVLTGDAATGAPQQSSETPSRSEYDTDSLPEDWENALGNWPPIGTTPLDKKGGKDRNRRKKS